MLCYRMLGLVFVRYYDDNVWKWEKMKCMFSLLLSRDPSLSEDLWPKLMYFTLIILSSLSEMIKLKKTLDIHKWEWVQPWGMVESYYSEISLCCIICECQYVFVYFVWNVWCLVWQKWPLLNVVVYFWWIHISWKFLHFCFSPWAARS